MLPIGRATFEFEEFLAACEYDLGCSPDTVSFYRKKVSRFLTWAQREKTETLDAQTVRQFFRWLKDQGLTDNGRHTYLRALRRWFNFLVRRKVIPQSPLVDADLRIPDEHRAGLEFVQPHARKQEDKHSTSSQYSPTVDRYPVSPHDHVIEAWLAAGPPAVVSHESALSLHGLSDVVPSAVHLVVPRSRRWVAGRVPPGVALHTTVRPLPSNAVTTVGVVRVTTPARSIVDAAEAGTAPDQILVAIRQALSQGLTTPRELRTVSGNRSARVRELVHGNLRSFGPLDNSFVNL